MLGTATRARLVRLLMIAAAIAALLPVTAARSETVVSIEKFHVPAPASLPSCDGCGSMPGDVTLGPDGAVWFTDTRGNRIGRLDRHSGEISTWDIPTPDSAPVSIEADRSGGIWFLETRANQIGRFDISSETFRELPVYRDAQMYLATRPDHMTLGPDGGIWLAAYHWIVRFDPQTLESTYTEISAACCTAIPNYWTPSFQGITAGRDGKLYLADVEGQGILRIDAAPLNNSYQSMVLADGTPNPRLGFFPVPGTSPLCYGCYQPESVRFNAMATAADGAIWFSDNDGIYGRMTTTGDFTLHDIGIRNTGLDITAGPDGAIWFLGTGEVPDAPGWIAPSIGRIGPTGGYRVYAHSWRRSLWWAPYGGIIQGPEGEGSLWFADPWEGNVGRVRIGSISAHGTAMTGGDPTPQDPVQVSVSAPTAGPVSIEVRQTDQPAPRGYTFLDQQVDIEAPAGSTTEPLYLEFRIHDSILPPDVDPFSLQVFRNGVQVGPCSSEDFAASDPCVSERTLGNGFVIVRIYTSHASAWNFALQPPFPFEGFFAPVDAAPTYNVAKAGSAIPMRFGLGGDHGVDVVAPGYPQAAAVDCISGAPLDAIEQTVTAGASSLSYDAKTGRYLYVWKTNGEWAGSCRRFVLRLRDGSTHSAEFKFAR
jgi:streptogramin lyase